jgi:hypothetical protein
MKIKTSYDTFAALLRALHEAKQSGDPEKIAQAQMVFDEYRRLCLQADEMILMRLGDLWNLEKGS